MVIATVILVIIAAADGGIGDIGGPSRRSPRLVFASALSPPSSSLPESAIRTIRSGGIAIVPDFLGPSDSSRLRRDASDLFRGGRFVVDSLAGYGRAGQLRDKSKFDPAKDRAVLPSFVPSAGRSGPFVDASLGDADGRRRLAYAVGSLRLELAHALDRPGLTALSDDEFAGVDGHEMSYTRFGPGASLARHVDEHHEEVKGRSGWDRPTRRSLSWLVYLNEDDWDAKADGGELRTHGRRDETRVAGPVGSRDGDLQIGWLAPTPVDDNERPVFLDGRRGGVSGRCALYVDGGGATSGGGRAYLTKEFDSDPYLFLTSDFFVRHLLISDRELGRRFRYVEPPHGRLMLPAHLLPGVVVGEEDDRPGELVRDVAPIGGTLVVFDSVALPHEVLPSTTRERWAASGWFHESQQPEPRGPGRIVFT